MKPLKKLEHQGFCMVRQPILSLDAFEDVKAKLDHLSRYPNDQVKFLLSDPIIGTSLQISAPGIAARLAIKAAKGTSRLEDVTSLLKYVTRMATRSTPFGVFSSVAFARISDQESTSIGDPHCKVRLDSGFLAGLHDHICRKLRLNETAVVRWNTTLATMGNQLRYYERKAVAHQYHFILISIEITPHLSHLLQNCEDNSSIGSLARSLKSFDNELTHEEALDFINELLDSDILELALGVPSIGSDTLEEYLIGVEHCEDPALDEQKNWLRKARERLNAKSEFTFSDTLDLIQNFAEDIRQLDTKSGNQDVLHIDSFRNWESVQLPRNLLPQLERTLRVLATVFPPPSDQALDRFARSFEKRYGESFVPLMHALDPELGIPFGFSAPVIPWTLGMQLRRKNGGAAAQTEQDEIIVKLITGQETEIDLAAMEIVPRQYDHSIALSVGLTIFSEGSSMADPGRYVAFLNYVSAPGANNLMARFAARDAVGTTFFKNSLQSERGADTPIIAEIVHTPYPRSANVLARPSSFEYVILLSGVAPRDAKVIPLSDLRIGVVAGRLVLVSASMKVQVIPRLTSAHNFNGQGNLAVYQFLCAIGKEEMPPFFQWPNSTSRARVLPRVRCGPIVVSPMRWRLEAEQTRKLTEYANIASFSEMRDLLIAYGIPRYTTWDKGDLRLEIDLQSDMSLCMLGHSIGREKVIFLHESIARLSPSWIKIDEKNFHSEIVLPLTLGGVESASKFRHTNYDVASWTLDDYSLERGDKTCWRYLKLYGGEEFLKNLCVESIFPIFNHYFATGKLKNWHFVRYADPDFHIRLRAQGSMRAVAELMNELAEQVLSPLLVSRQLAAVSSDVYLPEVRRYGGHSDLLYAEAVFTIDSIFASKVFALEKETGGDEVVWRSVLIATLQNIRLMLSTDMAESFVALERDKYANELDIDERAQQAISRKYRFVRSIVEDAIRNAPVAESPLTELLEARYAELKKLFATRVAMIQLSFSFVSGVTHMMSNRIFTSPSRYQEFLIFEFISRGMRSISARCN
ncbi:lantibiotic dehydratase [Duganella radicis]|uniref:Lantibiotic dehydratase n=1 Tax=Duganella radicis TaxID=551988 RepID=A0A6L6PQJ2_9BURK|nr:lantibiotic dehydratase [Duganella radicis]MTV41152.1 hypothetical protein [Duganella radicis]